MSNLTFKDYKSQISIMQVALSLGYRFDKTRGLNQPSFVLSDHNGKEIDRIYIKNPKQNDIQGYWRRVLNGNQKNSGDLISFIKENISSFNTNGARNEIDAINKVLSSFAGVALDSDALMDTYAATQKIWSQKSFDINRYEREHNNFPLINNVIKKRGINEQTVKTFLPFIEIVANKESKYNYKNIAFPYRKPGSDEIRGYEFRGFGGFKGAAEGSDRNALWIADFTNGSQAKFLLFAESAYDLMAFYQIHKCKMKLEDCVFLSTGGCFANEQVKNALDYYQGAKPIFCFDNDANGKMYDARALCLIYGIDLKASLRGDQISFNAGDRSFSLPVDFNISEFSRLVGITRQKNDLFIWKAPEGKKDWNEVLQKKTDNEEKINRYDGINNMRR